MAEPRGGEHSTPLPEITLRDTEELTAFLRAVRSPLDTYLADGKILRTEDGRAAVSLAMDLTEKEVPDAVPVIPLLAMSNHGEDAGTLPLNTVLIGARVWENGGNADRPHRPHYAPRGTEWAGRVVSNVRGLAADSPDPAAYRIESEEELASSAIMVRFAVRAAFNDSARPVLKIQRTRGGWQVGEQQTQYSNRRFAELVSKRPHDHERIFAYIEDRGAPKGKAGVEDLRAWLDSEMAQPLASGWL